MSLRLFEQVADDIAQSVEKGVLRAGDRLPSIRETSKNRKVSITTVKRAFESLESRGLIESRPQSGYFVRTRTLAAKPSNMLAAADPTTPPERDVSRLVLNTLQAIQSHEAAPFGSPFPDPALFPWRRIHQRTQEVARRFSVWDPMQDIPPGQPELVREIARRHQRNGLDVALDEIVVTAGATEAIYLSLQAVAKPGATIAVESPCFYATLEAIARLSMRVVEVPASAKDGIDLTALEWLLQRQRIDACVVMPNFQNPLGFVMSDESKRALVELAQRHDMPLIESGVYNELYYERAPSTLKSFDSGGLVLHCGSFSKSMAAGMRLGWTLPGRYRGKIETLKFLNTVATSGISQMAVAKFLRLDNWDHHLRGVRRTLQQRRDILRSMVERFFPSGTRTSCPEGGYLLWVELPGETDTLELHRQALQHGIAIAPGYMFGSRERFRHCLRLNYSYDWTPIAEASFMQLARMVGATVK